jgi:hypothetical protein
MNTFGLSGLLGGMGQGMNDATSLKKRMLAQNQAGQAPINSASGVGAGIDPYATDGFGAGVNPGAAPPMPAPMPFGGDPDAPMPNFYAAPPMTPSAALTDMAPDQSSFKDQMLANIMADNPRDKYSKKDKGGGSDMSGLLKMAMSLFGGGGG